MKTQKAELGDIIQAGEFAFGEFDYYHGKDGHLKLNRKTITVDGETKESLMQYRKPGTPWNKPAEYLAIDIGAYDPTRGKAYFVVENVGMQGGGTGHGPNDIYPDGWHVEARRLNEKNEYDPRGEVIEFYQTGCFNCMVPLVNKVGKVTGKKLEIKLEGKNETHCD
jgi:hypothetical protein